MSEEFLAKLNSRTDRRSFLRGSSLLAAAAGAALVLPRGAFTQNAQGGSNTEPAPDASQKNRDEAAQDGAHDDAHDGAKDGTSSGPKAKEGDGAETLTDANGRLFRICPQCGANMYRQGHTWTCENCGYSYDE